MKKRTIFLKMTINWDGYDDVDDELVVEDSGIYGDLKEGVEIEVCNADDLAMAGCWYLCENWECCK